MNEKVKKIASEKELFALIVRGNEGAFSRVFHDYNRRLYPFVRKMVKSEVLAEDIIQEIFTNLWTNRHLLGEVENPQSYLFTIAVNTTRRYLKQMAKELLILHDTEMVVLDEGENGTEEQLYLKDSEKMVRIAIDKLPPKRQMIYLLSREECKSYDEIAKLLNISRNTVKNQLVEALRYIRQTIQSTAGLIGGFIILFK